jgi:hypothetical protein
MYNSPLEYCPVCKTYVALDQSQGECAREHQCRQTRETCPLARHLIGPEPLIDARSAGNVSESPGSELPAAR